MIKSLQNFGLRSLVILGCSLTTNSLYSQEKQQLTLEECYQLAYDNYPLIKQYNLIEQSSEYSLSNVAKGYLPYINLGGQATHQSDVTQIPIEMPGMDVPTLSKDQYKVYAEVTQPITDLFTLSKNRKLVKAKSTVESGEVKVQLYQLKEQINQLYFGILLIERQKVQVNYKVADIEAAIKKNRVAIEHGVALKSSDDLLQAELLNAQQQIIELNASRRSFEIMLSLYIKQDLSNGFDLETPKNIALSNDIKRPELKLFEDKKLTFDTQRQILNNATLPQLSLFIQGGYGRPGLNMLADRFESYYVGGVKMAWNLSSFYRLRKEKKILGLNAYATDIQKEVFLFNTELSLKKQDTEITKLEELIKSDQQIILLRQRIRQSAQNQLENGTTTVNDYITYVNAENSAKQQLVVHQTQLLMAQYSHKTTSGN